LLGLPNDFTANHPSLREAFRNRYGLTDKDVAIGIVGRIVPIKNHAFFIKVIGSILTSPANRRAAFFIIGDGDLRKQLEDKLVEERIDFNKQGITEKSRVVFTSWLTDIDEVMNGLDIIALTSLNEGTPLSIIEAQFFKRPVVSTDVGGVRDTLEDGRTGFLIAKNDIESFCVKLSLLVNDDQLRVRMGEAGSQLAIERFSKQKEVERTKDFYFSLLQKKGCVV
jgi:glycosyltransferase involved in cell wall biosynthesis